MTANHLRVLLHRGRARLRNGRHPRRFLSDFLDGQPLTAPQRWSVRLHSLFCPMCRRYRRSLEATHEALVALRKARAPGSSKAR